MIDPRSATSTTDVAPVHAGALAVRALGLDDVDEAFALLAEASLYPPATAAEVERRLAPDRRCFVVEGSARPGEPLAIVEVALRDGLPSSVPSLLAEAVGPAGRRAVPYSIASVGVRVDVPLGRPLLDGAIASMQDEGAVDEVTTLSPVPGFTCWLDDALPGDPRTVAALLEVGRAASLADVEVGVRDHLLGLCATYLVVAKRSADVHDPVGRFHVRNGAQLDALVWAGDPSPSGRERSLGIMASYRYEPADIEARRVAYRRSIVPRSAAVDRLVGRAAGRG